MTNAEEIKTLQEIKGSLPKEFGLRAFPGDKFRLAPQDNESHSGPHYYSEYQAAFQVVIEIQTKFGTFRGEWLQFARESWADAKLEIVAKEDTP